MQYYRPFRARRPPQLPLDTPPTPPTPPPELSRRCQLCHAFKPIAEYSNRGGHPILKRCKDCRVKQQGENATRRQRKRAARLAARRAATRPARHTEIVEDSDTNLAGNVLSPIRSPQPPPSLPHPSRSASVARPPQFAQNPDLSEIAMSPSSRALVEEFHETMDELELETCSLCNERWFDMRLSGDICQRCRKDRGRNRDGKWGNANSMDPGMYLSHGRLTVADHHSSGPSLTVLCQQHGIAAPETPSQVEEMLLSKVHVQLQIWRVAGQQTKFAGHTCLFSRDNGALLTRLPLLPSELDVLIIKPVGHLAEQQNAAFGSRLEFQVKRARLLDNLNALCRFHPSYRRVEFNYEAIDSLPENGSVFGDLRSTTIASEQVESNDSGPCDSNEGGEDSSESLVSGAMIPNLGQSTTEVEDMLTALGGLAGLPQGLLQPSEPPEGLVLTQPALASTPINEHDTGLELLLQAFPFLFPQGFADIHATRPWAVKEFEYFKYLIRYKDGRFARHPRFLYFAFNMTMRWRTKRLANYYVSRNRQDQALTAADIAELLEEPERENLAKRVRKQGASLGGTAPYWGTQGQNLLAMIRQLGCPHAFITFSAADLQWPDLHQHMPSPPPSDAAEPIRQLINAQNVNNNPALTAWWFQKRFNVYFRKVVSPLLKVKDHCFRFEWQHRGSSHVHGLIWLDGAPSVDDLDLENVVSVRGFLDFWQSRVSANNPGPDLPPAPRHPCSIPHNQVSHTFRELAELLNRVQRHTRCTDAYCLRRPKGSAPDAPRSCRFKFPKELLDRAKLEVNESGHIQLFTARNDPLMNLHHPVLASGWQANTDFSPCTDSHAVATYIAKYVSKAEKPSANFAQVMRGICQNVEADTTGRVIFQKMLGKILTERDWSAQEVCHNLLQCDMTSASREFGTLCLLEDRGRRLRLEDDIDLEERHGEIESEDWRDQYYKRPPDHEEVSLYAWFIEYRKGKKDGPPIKRREGHEKIIRIWRSGNRGP